MIGYRYFLGQEPVFNEEGGGSEQIFDQLLDLLLHENDLNKSLELLKLKGIKGKEGGRELKGIHDFLEEVRRLKQKLQDAVSSNPSALEELKRLEKLETELRRASWGLDLEKINSQEIKELLGDGNYQDWSHLKNIPQLLELNGLIERCGPKYTLTPKGMRKIGQKALQNIFNPLLWDGLGNHATPRQGNGINLIQEESKAYQYGDPFHLNLSRTLLNTLHREGHSPRRVSSSRLLNMRPEDFEVYQTEKTTRSAIVLMLDMSGSMARDEKFTAAKKVALALHTLLHSQFPKDRLYLIGFSSYARSLKSKDLAFLSWDMDNPYTNMEEGLVLAQSFLRREHTPNKQIILISDGEPTAHLEDKKIFFQFPPHPKTLAKTIERFKKCAAAGIQLNIFMLGQDAHLVQFVREVSKINRGRAFYTTPSNLGHYLLVDFLAQKRKWIMG
jgi:uncharacterized protein with von Willebrand factor type A (vWA) domain